MLLLAALLCATLPRPAAAGDPFEDMPRASDPELAEMRGGIQLQLGGLDVRIAIGVETRVDDALLLRTEVGVSDLTVGSAQAVQHLPDSAIRAIARPRVEIAGDPGGTQVLHRVGLNDLAAVVVNHADGITIRTVGEMSIQIPNFRERELGIRSGLAVQAVSDLVDDSAARALSR